jgi:hypothetical protein
MRPTASSRLVLARCAPLVTKMLVGSTTWLITPRDDRSRCNQNAARPASNSCRATKARGGSRTSNTSGRPRDSSMSQPSRPLLAADNSTYRCIGLVRRDRLWDRRRSRCEKVLSVQSDSVEYRLNVLPAIRRRRPKQSVNDPQRRTGPTKGIPQLLRYPRGPESCCSAAARRASHGTSPDLSPTS